MDGQDSQVKMTYFHMPMSINFRHSMTMPAKFMNQFGGEISESIDIESPSGSVYSVKGTKYMNKKLPQCGWEAFVDAHHIEENDSLLFQYIEKARFKVMIIGPDGCEKVFPSNGIRVSSSNIQERYVDCVDVSHSSHDRADKSLRIRKTVSSYQRDCRPSQYRKAARITTTSVSSCEESGSEGTAEYEWSSGSDDNPKTNAAPDYVLSRKSFLSEEEEEQVDGLIKEIQPETTVLVVVMKPSTVRPSSGVLVIPQVFADAHLPRRNQMITLQRPGKNKKWPAKFQARKEKTGTDTLSGPPWSNFVKDNHLQQGDICIFQPLKTVGKRFTRFTLMVYLIRQSKVGALHEHGISLSPGSARETSSSRELGDSDEQYKTELYTMSCRTHLTDEQRKKVEDIVGSIQSQGPIYVAVMNKTNVAPNATTLYFAKEYTSKYLPGGEHIVTLMMNENSTTWRVKMYPRRLSHGWLGFVRDNHLKLDDICIFQLTNDDIEMLTMTVYIIRDVDV